MDTNQEEPRNLTKKERKLLRHQERMFMEEQTKKQTSYNKWLLWSCITVFVVIVIGIIYFTSANQSSNQSSNTPTNSVSINPNNPHLVQDRLSHATLDLSNNPTWQPNATDLPAVMSALHLPFSDPPQLHHHDHLDIYIKGQKVVVPQDIGLSNEAEVPTHTHDQSGIIHIETVDANFNPTLGLFFDVWGVSFTQNNLGGYTVDEKNKLIVFINGKQYQGDPRQIPLMQHDEIVITFGEDSQLPQPMPSSAEFPNGL